MTDQTAGPRCGNNPNLQLTPGDRKAVDDFKARLALQAAAKPYIDSAVWVDGDPLMEVIAVTIWQRCAHNDENMPQLVLDDPRTIAAFAAAVARAAAVVPVPAPTDRAALDRVRALHLPKPDGSGFPDSMQCRTCSYDGGDGYQYLVPWPCPTVEAADEELRRVADETQQPTDRPSCPDPIECGHEAALGQAEMKLEQVHATATAWARELMTEPTRVAGLHLLRILDGAEAQQPETQAEDPARIDRLRPEFFEHASVEAIDSQVRRAQTQHRAWGNRERTLNILRQARVKQMELGEWPAAVSQPGKER
ncbi:hypothetical protein ACFWFF_01430 [Streptomyces sp. NPDC060223]|uniref:hypothetical protein n=1 Tax=unclassified Streptomyces TaxID=2593676 RepID=UPI00363A3044